MDVLTGEGLPRHFQNFALMAYSGQSVLHPAIEDSLSLLHITLLSQNPCLYSQSPGHNQVQFLLSDPLQDSAWNNRGQTTRRRQYTRSPSGDRRLPMRPIKIMAQEDL